MSTCPELLRGGARRGSLAGVEATRVAARERAAAARRDGTLIASVCPGPIDPPPSRPWFDHMSSAATPGQAAVARLQLASGDVDQSFHGELVRSAKVIPWG